jgi:beta-N-acetylhexosaminidase
MMKAVHDRYGHARASVMALQAGADMVLAQGARHEQLEALTAITQAQQKGTLLRSRLWDARTRLETLASRYPAATGHYSQAQRDIDEALMRRTWVQALCAVAHPLPPQPDAALRVVTQNTVASDGVSEAGLPCEKVRALFGGFSDVEFVTLPDLTALTQNDLPRDKRFNVLVSNHRGRYGVAGQNARADLHVVLWNPFQAMDIDAPTLITWGYADGACVAAREWLLGHVSANALPPVPLS